MEIEHRRVELKGLGLHVAMIGPENGEPLLFMHGFPEFWMEWAPAMRHFARLGYRCIAPDQRGYGDSDKPQHVAAYHIDRLADDIDELCQALGLAQVTLVAHDWGGLVAWHCLERHAERVRALFVINAPHASVWKEAIASRPTQLLKSWYVLAFQLPWLPERMLAMNNGATGMKMSGLDQFLDEAQQAHYRGAWKKGLRTMIHWYRAAIRYAPYVGQSPENTFEQPVYVLWGTEDRFLNTRLAEKSAALCGTAEVAYLEGVSHWVAQEAPDAMIEHLEGFLVSLANQRKSA